MKKLLLILLLMQITLSGHSQFKLSKDCAIAYKDWNFENTLFKHQLQLCPGEWTVKGGGDYWNDKISSIRIPAGLIVEVYEHEKYGGEKMTLIGDWTVSGSNDRWNDRISSIRVIKGQPAPGQPSRVCEKTVEATEFYRTEDDKNRAINNFKSEARAYCNSCGGVDWKSTDSGRKPIIEGQGATRTIKIKGIVKCKGQ